ncbi:MAG: hypothetical protein WDA47_01630 [Bacilli bacterium]
MARNKWTWEGSSLSCDRLGLKIDLVECFPSWEKLSVGERFLAQYGVKQWISSGLAGVIGADKLKETASSLAQRAYAHDFARQTGGGGGVTKAELKAERDELAAKVAALEAELAASKVVLRKKGK